MRSNNAIYILLVFILSLIFSQSNAQLYSLSWLNTFGSDSVNSDVQVVKICNDDNQNYYVLSNRDSSSYTYVICLAKYNSSGIKLWERIYANSFSNSAIATSLICDSDKIYIGGYETIPSHSDDYLVLRYDTAGNFIWKFNFDGLTHLSDLVQDMQIDIFGNIIVTGQSYLTGDPTFYRDILTCRINENGNLLWYKYFNYPSINNINCFPYLLNTDKSGNIIIAGWDLTVNLWKLDSSGNILWESNGITNVNVNGLRTDDSCQIYLIDGTLDVYKSDSSGNLIWNKNFFNTLNGVLNSIEIDKNNLYLAGGIYSSPSSVLENCLTIKMDLNGDTIWSRIYSSGLGNTDYGAKIISHNNGELSVIGFNFDSITKYNGLVLRYDSSGQLIWNVHYDDTLHDNDFFLAAAADSLNNLFIGGKYRNVMTLFGINSSGNFTLETDVPNYQRRNDEASQIIYDHTGNLIVGGVSNQFYEPDIVILKYSSTGSLLWKKRIITSGGCILSQIKCDLNNNIFICGTGIINNSIHYIINSKIDPAGNIIYTNLYNSPGITFDEAAAISYDSVGNSYILETSKDSNGIKKVSLLKYNSSGNFLWSKIMGDSSFCNGNGCLIYSNDNSFYESFTKNSNGVNQQDITTVKVDTAGSILWKQVYNSPASNVDMDRKLIIDHSGNVIVAGLSDSISRNIMIIKYDSGGNYKWSTRYFQYPQNYLSMNDLVCDLSDNIYLTGEEDSGWVASVVTLKLTPNGIINWVVHKFNGFSNSSATGNGIALGDGNIIVTGRFIDANYISNIIVIAYDTSGSELFLDTIPSGSSSVGNDVLYDGNGCYYFTGTLDSFSNMTDYVTFKYCNNSVGIDNLIDLSNIVTLFPNPSNGSTAISFYSGKKEYFTLEIFNFLGMKVDENKYLMDEGFSVINYGNNLKPGIYLISLKNNDKIFATKKFLKME